MSVINMSVKEDLLSFHELNNNYTLQQIAIEQPPQRKYSNNSDNDTRLKQLYNQIEQLTLTNARLVRANRILKLECDKIVEEQTSELKQALKTCTEQNIRLQRSNRILKDEYDNQANELNNIKNDQILKMKNIGPEYEYLVQVVNLLYRQLAGNTDCDRACCYTEKKPPTSNRHHCRPVIQSHIPATNNRSTRLELENAQLKSNLEELSNDKSSLYKVLKDKETDNEALKYEIKLKDDIVKQLEQDFEKMESDVNELQKDFMGKPSMDSSSFSEINRFPSVPIIKGTAVRPKP